MLKEYKTLLPLARQYRWWYAAGVLCLGITDGGQLIVPQLMKRAIDTISTTGFSLTSVLRFVFGIIILALFIGAGRFGWRFFIHGASRRIEKNLRGRLYSHIQTLSSGFFGSRKTGDLMAHFTNDMEAVRRAIGMALVALLDGVFMTLAILLILFRLDKRLALLTIAPLPVITGMILFFGRSIGERFRKVQEGFANLSDMVQESFAGIRVLKAFVREESFVQKFREKNDVYCKRNIELVRIWGLFFPLITFLSGMTNVIFLLLGGGAVIDGRFSAGDFTAYIAYLGMLIWPMMGAGFTINMLQRGAASLGRINTIFTVEPEITSPAEPDKRTRAGKIRGDITIKNLTFSYGGENQPVLSGISISVPAGTSLGILGRTGSGKSTLVRLLPRLIDPPEGTVFLDGIDIRKYNLQTLRKAFGVVPQDIFLFSATIMSNIGYGCRREECGDNTPFIREMAELSTITRDAKVFPLGLDTMIGERGVSLSGGQKQRVALARALASEPSVLILDDSFSAVDTETENTIIKQLKPFMENKTTVLISHRISTLHLADCIIVLDNGEIIQKGTHESLLKEDGFYREIYEIQRLEEGLEADHE